MNLNCVYPAQAQVCLNSHLFNYFLTFPFRLPDIHLKLFLPKPELPTKPCITHLPPISVDGNFILWVTQAKSIEVILDSSLSQSPPSPFKLPTGFAGSPCEIYQELTASHRSPTPSLLPPWFDPPSSLTGFAVDTCRQVLLVPSLI